MAAESSSRSAPGDGCGVGVGGGAPSADSYIGSLISLTTKSEIRYEGMLYNINTEESSIGLRYVRAFGTEGRKKDGPQIAAGDKIYEYIVFRGTDIKDLQVKSSPPVQSAQLHHDPAIIQSHYSPRPPSVTSVPPGASGTATDLSSQASQYGLQRSSVQGNLPPYQPTASSGSWGPSPAPPTSNASALAMPMYWQGYYTPSGVLAHMQQVQPPLMRPPPGLPTSQSTQQPLQHTGTNTSFSNASSKLPEFSSPLFPPATNNVNVSPASLPLTSISTHFSSLAPETSSTLANENPTGTLPSVTNGPSLPFIPATLTPNVDSTATKSQPSVSTTKTMAAPNVNMPYQTISLATSSIFGPSNSGQLETLVPLLTPDQLLPPASTNASLQPSQTSGKDSEVKPAEDRMKPLLPEPVIPATAANKEPILPLPVSTDRKSNGTAVHNHYPYRGRGRGRGRGHASPVTRFKEDFDFTAMNEKFNKDEVWGHLGKGKNLSRDKDGDEEDSDDASGEDDAEGPKLGIKPTYVKDDFFDTISCNTLDPRIERTKFSEQLKLDVETFGDYAKHRPNRVGGRGYRGSGGGRSRGSYYGRGRYSYGGRRGRGNPLPSHSS